MGRIKVIAIDKNDTDLKYLEIYEASSILLNKEIKYLITLKKVFGNYAMWNILRRDNTQVIPIDEWRNLKIDQIIND